MAQMSSSKGCFGVMSVVQVSQSVLLNCDFLFLLIWTKNERNFNREKLKEIGPNNIFQLLEVT
jgi:hypothetical protein